MDPGPLIAVRGLESPDFVVAPQCQQDLIETFEQSGAAAGVDFKTVLLSRRRRDGLRLKIDADASRSLRVLDLRGKAIDNLFIDNDGEDSVLEAVGKENIAEA